MPSGTKPYKYSVFEKTLTVPEFQVACDDPNDWREDGSRKFVEHVMEAFPDDRCSIGLGAQDGEDGQIVLVVCRDVQGRGTLAASFPFDTTFVQDELMGAVTATMEDRLLAAEKEPATMSYDETHVPETAIEHVGNGILYPKLKGDVGYDLEVSEDTVIPMGGFANIPHDAAVCLPEGYWALIVARSGTNLGGKLLVLTGVIDNGYRGRLMTFVHNLSHENILAKKGDRLAQMVLFPVSVFPLHEVGVLPPSERSTRGFGSSGGSVEEVANPNHVPGEKE